MQLNFSCDDGPIDRPISPYLEMGAYEALRPREGAMIVESGVLRGASRALGGIGGSCILLVCSPTRRTG
jgi:hypothetical protein